MKRRTFLVGGLYGAPLLLLTACTEPTPVPTKTPAPTPTPTRPALPKPSAFLRTSWAVDPFSFGSQSYLGVGATPTDRAVLSHPVEDKVFLAGEATDTERPATVSGAWLSGIRVAEQVAEHAEPGERIVIVGAGVAGATAARQLVAAGYSVIVVEARNRIGGRIDTVSSDAWPFPVERGAGMVHDVAGSPIIGELAALKVATKLVDDTMEVRTGDGVVVTAPEEVADPVTSAVAWAKNTTNDVSLRAALEATGAQNLPSSAGKNGVSAADWLEHFLHSEVEQQNGADLDLLSGRFGWSPDSDGRQRAVIGGYQQLVHSALSGVDVRLSSVVTVVAYGHDAVGIRFATGESMQADRIVMTVPLGVLKSESLTFDPPLPATHQEAIAALGMGKIEKVLLRFDHPFWTTDAQVWSVIRAGDTADLASSEGTDENSRLITRWINLEPVTGEAILVGLAAAEQAEKLAGLDDDEVRTRAMADLAPFLVRG